MSNTISKIESFEEDLPQDKPQNVVKRWEMELDLACEEMRKWKSKSEKIIKRYRDDASVVAKDSRAKGRRLNIFWSNVQTLMPALYSKTPEPRVVRRFKDSDPVGRAASQLLERATEYQLDEINFDEVVSAAVLDYLTVARGTAWVRYVPQMTTVQRNVPVEGNEQITDHGEAYTEYTRSEDGETVDIPEGGFQIDEYGNLFFVEDQEEVEFETVEIDFVPWDKFHHAPAERWEGVRWVARQVEMTRDMLIERFGEEIGQKVPLDVTPKIGRDSEESYEELGQARELMQRATVYEIWDKEEQKVYWINKNYKKGPLDTQDPPLTLRGFFPCPKPLYATMTHETLVPVADFTLYEHQATEVDQLTSRIAAVTPMVKVVAWHDGACTDIENAFLSGTENTSIPVKNWPQHRASGGARGMMDFFPTETAISTLATLQQLRREKVNEIYEITGISDIIRGSTSPTETATAQQIKSQYGQLRLSARQKEVQRFARDLIEMVAEVIAEQFSEETLIKMAGGEQLVLDDEGIAVHAMQAIELLRSDVVRNFRIDIESDSTIALDERMEKDTVREFFQAVSGFTGAVFQAAQQEPRMVPFYGELMLAAIRRFGFGRNLETNAERLVKELTESAKQRLQQPPQPDPRVIEAQQKQQMKAAEMQLKQREAEQKMQLQVAELQAEVRGMQQKYEIEMQKLAVEAQQKQQEMMNDLRVEAAKIASKESIELRKAMQRNA
jgi:hypothetical protein